MPYCQGEDGRIYYEEEGSGFPLLLISGLGEGTWLWYEQRPFFREYYRVITFDNRGSGKSDAPEGPYTMRQLAADALRLLDALDIRETFVVGFSMGGMIALELSLMAPERVRSLVLVSSHCGGELSVQPAPETLDVFLVNGGMTREEILRKNLPVVFSEETLAHKPEVVEAYVAAQLGAERQPPGAFRWQIAAILEYDCSDRVTSLATPILLIAGSRDLLTPRENVYLMAETLPRPRVVMIPGGGHAIHLEHPDWVNEIIDSFLQEHAPFPDEEL